MKTYRYKVVLKEIKHLSMPCFEIGFNSDNELEKIIKSIDHVKYNTSQNTFYVSKNKMSLHQLFTSLNDRNIYVDYSEIIKRKKNNSQKDKPKRVARNLSEDRKKLLKLFVSYLKGLRLSENTINVYYTFIADFVTYIGEKPIEDLSNNDVRLFVENQVNHKRYAISTHRQMVSAIKHFGNFLPKSNLEVEDLTRPKKSRHLPTVLSKEEIVDLLRATKNLKHRTIIAMLYSAGLRISEVLSLELKDIDVDRRQLFIKNAKGRKDRVVIMAESFIPLYSNYFMTYKPNRFFVENPNGGIYSAGSIRKFLKRSCDQAGIKKRVTPHTFRHSFATHLIEDGVGLRHVQDLLGHSKPETTMIYTHVAKKDLLKIQSPLDSALLSLSSGDKNHNKVRLSNNLIK